jgi:hypothetical protein
MPRHQSGIETLPSLNPSGASVGSAIPFDNKALYANLPSSSSALFNSLQYEQAKSKNPVKHPQPT